MMRQYELVERVQAYNPHADEALLNRAYVYAMQKHGSQKRASGDPYFAHPLEVAGILTDLKMDDATIAVALLHDTIEDTDATRTEIDSLFGSEIGELVEGLTKIERLNLVSREEAQAENLRKLLLGISQDVRVLLVKLADRLHNMRTIEFMRDDQRQRIARETMEIYAPLAGRMGMQDMRTELETISFSVLQPEHFSTITARLSEIETDNAKVITTIETDLRDKLADKGISADVKARLKAPWSIFRKIETKSLAFEQLSDIIGFRIIVDTLDNCYRALGVVHANWKMVPGRFKDYVSVPKYNDYQSIHTTIVGPERRRVELQIRTQEMHEVAEYGIAAHALYKDGQLADLKRLEGESKAYAWLRSTIDHLTKGSDPAEFVEFTKLELFQDQVFCFTPRGRLIALPRGATPIDFAYAVHTDIGDTCVGAKINGVLSPLITQLRNGDEVQILRDYNHAPPPNWETIAATGKARAAIRRNVRHREQARIMRLGSEVLSLVMQQNGIEDEEEGASNLSAELGYKNKAELIEAIGKGKVEPEKLETAVDQLTGRRSFFGRRRRIKLPAPTQQDGWFTLRESNQFRFRIPGGQNTNAAVRRAMDMLDFNTPVWVSPEGVVPGDRLVGIVTADGGVTVYPIQSDALTQFAEGEAGWIDVMWEPELSAELTFPAAISMLSANQPGMLARVTATIAESDVNILNLVLRRISMDFHQLVFQVEVRDVLQLEEVLTMLHQQVGLTRVRRASHVDAQAIAVLETAELPDDKRILN